MIRAASSRTCISWTYGKLYVDDWDQYWMDGLTKAVVRHTGSACGNTSGDHQLPIKEGVVAIVGVGRLRAYINRGKGTVLWLPLCDGSEGRDVQASLERGGINTIYRRDSVDTVIEKLVGAYRVREQLDGMRRWGQPPQDTELTTQERRVIRLIGTGHSPGTIARTLGIHPKTVSAHKCSVMRKLGLRRTQDLFHWLQFSGFLKLKSK